MKSIFGFVECAWPAGAVLGEGPVYDTRRGRLVWLDIKGLKLYAYEVANGSQRTWNLKQRLCSIDLAPNGWESPPHFGGDTFLGCGDHGFGWISLESEHVVIESIVHPEADLPLNRFNDGKIGPDGRYWAGTMDDTETAATGSLYAFSRDGSWSRLDTGYRVTNGPAFSPDGRTVYHTDSALQTIYAFDLTLGGALTDKRVFHQFAEGEGYPDGMTCDAEGCIWIAMWDGHRIEKLSAYGERLGSVAMPVARPTSCAFSTSDQNLLFVTSAAIGSPQGDATAGSLLSVRLST